ncbi:MAG: hypothetical protein KDA58_12770 [Planctomycetaceae bacterium]|nr:hypothetical protein [Planctomycetaceae bacterium]
MSWFRLLAVLLLTFGVSGMVQAEPRSIEEFMTFKDKWPQLVQASSTWNLEGRYGFIAAGEMRFAQCPLKFLLPGDERFAPRNSNVVEVTGKLVLDGKDVVFQVSRIVPRPSDMQTLASRRALLNTRQSEAWYALGDWALGRGTFYNDDDLKVAAHELFQQGIETERIALKTGQVEELLALATKAESYRVNTPYVRELRHQAYREQFDLIKADPKADLGELVLKLKEQFPASGRRLPAYDADTERKYQADPLAEYAAARTDLRDIYDRLFVLELEMLRIGKRIKADGSNGNEIAALYETMIPERPELPQQFREKELDYHFSRVASMTRTEMLELSEKFVAREEPGRGLAVKENWLKAREPRMRRDGARGLCEFAEDWITLTEDYETARGLYIEAYRLNPGYPPSTVWLEANGYVLHQNKWIPADQAPPSGDAEMRKAIEEGRVLLGMTSEQVRSALGTVPTRTLRFARSRGATELLVFETSGLVVRMDRDDHRAPLKVVEIRTQSNR